MMRPNSYALLVALLAVAGCDGAERPQNKPAGEPSRTASPTTSTTLITSSKPRSAGDPVAASIMPAHVRARRGETFELSVVLDIAPFYEIHPLAAPPPDVSTSLRLALPAGFEAASDWSEPPMDPSERPGAHGAHVGLVKFTRKIQVTDDAVPGGQELTCSIRYQACNARACLAPVSFTLLANVSVEPGR